MGLDAVELILSIEETFEVSIPNSAAERLMTVGDLHEYIVAELVRLDRPNTNEDVIYDLLRNLICFQLGVKPEQVTLGAHFIHDLHID